MVQGGGEPIGEHLVRDHGRAGLLASRRIEPEVARVRALEAEERVEPRLVERRLEVLGGALSRSRPLGRRRQLVEPVQHQHRAGVQVRHLLVVRDPPVTGLGVAEEPPLHRVVERFDRPVQRRAHALGDGFALFVPRVLEQVQERAGQDGLLAPAHAVLARIEVLQDPLGEAARERAERLDLEGLGGVVGVELDALAGNGESRVDGLADVAQHLDELVGVDRPRVPEVDRAVRLEEDDVRKPGRAVPRVGGVVDVGVDEDVDEVTVEVRVDVVAVERAFGELVAPVAPLGREQQEVRSPLLQVARDHVVGVVLELHLRMVVVIGEGRRGRRQRQDRASKEKRACAGVDRRRHHPCRSSSSSTFRRSASMPSSPATSPTSAPSASTRRMVSGWEIV